MRSFLGIDRIFTYLNLIITLSVLYMLKFILILVANTFFLYCLILFFIDNRIITKDPFTIIQNTLLFILGLWITYNLATIYVFRKEKQESGLIYKLASKTKSLGVSIYHLTQSFQKELIIWTIAAIALSFLGLITMGIPGFFWLEIPVKLGIVSELKGDALWPSAIAVSMLWPLFFPVGVLVKHQLIKMGYVSYAITGFWGVVVGGIAAVLAFVYLGAGRGKV